MSSTVTSFPPPRLSLFLYARIDNQAKTAQIPSFSRIWSDPVKKLNQEFQKPPDRSCWLFDLMIYYTYVARSLPVPKLSSPQMEHNPASIKFPKNFQPVGTYNHRRKVIAFHYICAWASKYWHKNSSIKPQRISNLNALPQHQGQLMLACSCKKELTFKSNLKQWRMDK